MDERGNEFRCVKCVFDGVVISPELFHRRLIGNVDERPLRFLFFRGRVDREEEKKKGKKKKKIGHAFDGNSLTRERERERRGERVDNNSPGGRNRIGLAGCQASGARAIENLSSHNV